MTKLYCPVCGKQNVGAGDTSPNGGQLYVAEEVGFRTEYYDDANPFECEECGTFFYLGSSNDE